MLEDFCRETLQADVKEGSICKAQEQRLKKERMKTSSSPWLKHIIESWE